MVSENNNNKKKARAVESSGIQSSLQREVLDIDRFTLDSCTFFFLSLFFLVTRFLFCLSVSAFEILDTSATPSRNTRSCENACSSVKILNSLFFFFSEQLNATYEVDIKEKMNRSVKPETDYMSSHNMRNCKHLP